MPVFNFDEGGSQGQTTGSPSISFTDSGVTFTLSGTALGGSPAVSHFSMFSGGLFMGANSATSAEFVLDVTGPGQTQFSGAPLSIQVSTVSSAVWNVIFHGASVGATQVISASGTYSAQGQITHITFTNTTTDGSALGILSLSANINCFLEGTQVASPDGMRAVESLQPGDMIATAEGGVTEVKWVGRQKMLPRFSQPEEINPIRIQAGALGENMPTRDLFVTADHAFLMDGLLVTASALVNGSTIAQVAKMPIDGFTYYHIDTGAHEAVLAEGLPAETLFDYSGRQVFDNEDEHAHVAPILEMDLPRITSPRLLPESISARIAERAEKLSEEKSRLVA